MIDERDMYYGYGGYIPMNNMGMTNPNMGMTNQNGQMQQIMPNNYSTSQFSDMNKKIRPTPNQIRNPIC